MHYYLKEFYTNLYFKRDVFECSFETFVTIPRFHMDVKLLNQMILSDKILLEVYHEYIKLCKKNYTVGYTYIIFIQYDTLKSYTNILNLVLRKWKLKKLLNDNRGNTK